LPPACDCCVLLLLELLELLELLLELLEPLLELEPSPKPAERPPPVPAGEGVLCRDMLVGSVLLELVRSKAFLTSSSSDEDPWDNFFATSASFFFCS